MNPTTPEYPISLARHIGALKFNNIMNRHAQFLSKSFHKIYSGSNCKISDTLLLINYLIIKDNSHK